MGVELPRLAQGRQLEVEAAMELVVVVMVIVVVDEEWELAEEGVARVVEEAAAEVLAAGRCLPL